MCVWGEEEGPGKHAEFQTCSQVNPFSPTCPGKLLDHCYHSRPHFFICHSRLHPTVPHSTTSWKRLPEVTDVCYVTQSSCHPCHLTPPAHLVLLTTPASPTFSFHLSSRSHARVRPSSLSNACWPLGVPSLWVTSPTPQL